MTGGKFSLPRASDPDDRDDRDGSAREAVPLGGTRAEAQQRLQVGLAGIGSIILVIALASVIGTQANITEEAAVPDAAPTTEPTQAPAQRDPLADAGIVPDIQAEPTATPTPSPTLQPQTGQSPPAANAPPPANANPGD